MLRAPSIAHPRAWQSIDLENLRSPDTIRLCSVVFGGRNFKLPSMHHLFGRPAPRPHGQLGFQRAKEDTFHMKSVGLIFTQNLHTHKPFGGKIVQCHGFSFTVIRTEIWSTTQVRSTMLFLARGVSRSPEQTQPKEWIIISFKFVRRVLLSDSSKRYNYLSPLSIQ